MPLAQLLQSLTGTCRHCNQPAALLQRTHPQCRQTLGDIAQRSHAIRPGHRTGPGGGLPAGSHPGTGFRPEPFPNPLQNRQPPRWNCREQGGRAEQDRHHHPDGRGRQRHQRPQRPHAVPNQPLRGPPERRRRQHWEPGLGHHYRQRRQHHQPLGHGTARRKRRGRGRDPGFDLDR